MEFHFWQLNSFGYLVIYYVRTVIPNFNCTPCELEATFVWCGGGGAGSSDYICRHILNPTEFYFLYLVQCFPLFSSSMIMMGLTRLVVVYDMILEYFGCGERSLDHSLKIYI